MTELDIQPIYNLAELCYQHGVRHVIISPGSRSAPLTLAFTRHPEMIVRVIPDERSAAFIAVGMSQTLKDPVVLICTSGSAVYNYAPAVSEAYFSRTPLLIFSADRPPEWWGQQDGQTIFQDEIFGKHVVYSKSLPVDLDHKDAQWQMFRQATEAIHVARTESRPVHLNFPFREPFYPASKDPAYFESPFNIIQQVKGPPALPSHELSLLAEEWMLSKNKLILGGQQHPENRLLRKLNEVSVKWKLPVSGDIIANLHSLEHHIHGTDMHLRMEGSEDLKPDLLITFGQSILSKNIKKFFRNHPPRVHWHIEPQQELIDTFQSMSRHIQVMPADFFQFLSTLPVNNDFTMQTQANYLQLWKREENAFEKNLNELFESDIPLGEFQMVREALQVLPDNTNLHLANSLAVRYANLCGLQDKDGVVVYSNRGACGIDGCNSTAVGAALADPERINLLVTGDMAFFYDRNAFWHNYSLPNLRILVLNNHGGGIFRMIPGPSSQPELEPFFETTQKLTAEALAAEYGFDYIRCNKKTKMNNLLQDFFLPDKRVKIMEIETLSSDNQDIMRIFKEKF